MNTIEFPRRTDFNIKNIRIREIPKILKEFFSASEQKPPSKPDESAMQKILAERFIKRAGYKLSLDIKASDQLSLQPEEQDFFYNRFSVRLFHALWPETNTNEIDAWGNQAAPLFTYMNDNKSVERSFLQKDTPEERMHKRALDLAALNIVNLVTSDPTVSELKRKILHTCNVDEEDLTGKTLFTASEETQSGLEYVFQRWKTEIEQHRPPTSPLPRAA